MMMEPRISIITLGVDDLDRAARFYEAMGFKRNKRFAEGVAFFQLGGLILALWPREELARDAGLSSLRSGSGVALAHNTRRENEVPAILERAKKAGGRILKPAERAFWGGTQGYFQDTEGNLWEVAHNPDFQIDDEGRVRLPE
jgi:uncharacterized protein